jgi:hypothetical protein
LLLYYRTGALWVPVFCFLWLLFVLVWFACVFDGIRVLLLVLQALPLCGAAPTFLCRGKEK